MEQTEEATSKAMHRGWPPFWRARLRPGRHNRKCFDYRASAWLERGPDGAGPSRKLSCRRVHPHPNRLLARWEFDWRHARAPLQCGMADSLEVMLRKVVADLQEALGDNLYSCCLYGSAVRGNFDDDTSDINLLILLQQSDTHAHLCLAEVLKKHKRIDPFILARRGFERSFRMFSPKFASIQRHHRVLCGADPLCGLKVRPEEEKFLTEQAFRNLRLRLVYAFVTREQRRKGYERFLLGNITPLFVQLSDIVRLSEIAVPKDFRARVPVFETQFGIDGSVLYDLLDLKADPKRLSDKELVIWHERLFPLIDHVLVWVEENWPSNPISS